MQIVHVHRGYVRLLGQPLPDTSYIEHLLGRLTQALVQCNRAMPQNPHVHLAQPAANDERRLFAVERLTAQPEPPSLAQLKQRISQRYGMLDLLDVFVEADRLVGFTHAFTHSGTKAVRSREALRPLLLLDLFAEGTNTG